MRDYWRNWLPICNVLNGPRRVEELRVGVLPGQRNEPDLPPLPHLPFFHAEAALHLALPLPSGLGRVGEQI